MWCKVNPQTPITLSQSLYPSLPTNPRSCSSSQLSSLPMKIRFWQTFLALGMQYSITFNNLMADTSYTFTIRIVLRANTTVDVVPAAMGSFMTLMTPSKLVYALVFPLLVSIIILTEEQLFTQCQQRPLLPPLPWLLPPPLHSNTHPTNWCPSGWRLWWWLYCWFFDCSIDTCGHRCHRSATGTKQEVSYYSHS